MCAHEYMKDMNFHPSRGWVTCVFIHWHEGVCYHSQTLWTIKLWLVSNHRRVGGLLGFFIHWHEGYVIILKPFGQEVFGHLVYYPPLYTYLTLRSVSALNKNTPQNSEMKFCEKYEVDMLKIIIILIGYTLNNFTTYITILY